MAGNDSSGVAQRIAAVHPRPDQERYMPYAPAVRVAGPADILFISGSTSSPLYHRHPHVADEHRHPIDIESQTRRAMEGIKLVLDDQGLTWRHVVKVTKYLTDMRDMDGMVEVLSRVFRRLEAGEHDDLHQRALDARCAGRARHDRRASARLIASVARSDAADLPPVTRDANEGDGAGQPASPVPLLALRNVIKTFPGVRALDDVSLDLHAGEVHMLLGENGAGKSSLIKVLYGAYRADAGTILYEGKPVEIARPADARRLGIAVIFQEFSLVPFLDLAQNIFLGREPRRPLTRLIDHARMHREARAVLDSLGLDYDTRALATDLGVAQQQMVEIAKALSQRARILVMDEPTAALSERESNALFALIRQLRASGVAIVYISHRMQEVFELGDRVTVLRDGRRVATLRRGRGDARPADRHDGRTRGRRRVQAAAVWDGGRDRAGRARIDDRDRRARCRPQRA